MNERGLASRGIAVRVSTFQLQCKARNRASIVYLSGVRATGPRHLSIPP